MIKYILIVSKPQDPSLPKDRHYIYSGLDSALKRMNQARGDNQQITDTRESYKLYKAEEIDVHLKPTMVKVQKNMWAIRE